MTSDLEALGTARDALILALRTISGRGRASDVLKMAIYLLDTQITQEMALVKQREERTA